MIEKTYHIITFGCQMNVHDSHWLGRALGARGFFEAPLEDAQVVVVNTCSVREKPEQKVMSTLGRIRQVSGGNPAVLVCVAGCVAQQLGESIFEKESQVRLVAGSDGIGNAPQAIERLLENPAQRLSLLDFTSQYVEREGTTEPGVVSGSVAYANKQELELAIMCRHVRMPAASGAAPASNKADARRGQQADPSAGHHGQEPPDGQKSLRP